MKQGWEIKKLGEVCSITMGQSPSSDTYNDSEGLPFFQGNADFGKIHPSIRVYCNAPIRIADVDDILISVRAPIGAINIADCKCCIGRGLASIRNNAEVANEYIYHALIANKERLIAQGTGSTFKSIGKEALKELSIPVPPREEQERIVEELDCLSGVIEKKREQLRELDALAQSIFFQMFGDPITNEKGWEIKTIGDVCKLKSGDSSANNTSEGSLPYIKVGDMNMSENVPYITTSSTLVSREENIKGIFPIGTTIFPKRGGAIFTNKKRLTTVEICCDLNTMGVIPMHEVLPLYIFHFFIQIDFGELCNGAAIPQINNIDIAPLKICVPPLALQQEFADKIEAIEKQKELIKKSISETETLFNARMDYYFN